jgi:tRNA nucleotidyltransferase (CCA-adding enzyme)
MKKYLERLPKELQDLIRLSSEVAQANKMHAYLVGGFVRDLILGVRNLDLDIVVEKDGIKFAEDLASHLKANLIRHKRFGTATVTLGHNLKIDIATAREEVYPVPASLPSVTSGTVKDDLKRRDFSINAMAISINKENYAELIDFYHGRLDLRNKKIRVLHDLSFIDDPTRILRAIRFEQRFNFKIEPRTLKLLKEANRLRMIERVQPQRLRDELILILKEKNPIRVIRRLSVLVGLSFIYSDLKLTKSNYALLKNAEKEVNWFKRTYPQRRHLDTWLVYLMALIDNLDLSGLRSIFKAFVFRKGEEKRMLTYKKMSAEFIRQLSQKGILPSRIFHLLDPLSYEVILLIKAKYKNKNLNKHIEDFLEIYNFIRISVTGHDLYRLGIEPGPYYQKIFARVFKAKLDGCVSTKEEELALINKLIRIR